MNTNRVAAVAAAGLAGAVIAACSTDATTAVRAAPGARPLATINADLGAIGAPGVPGAPQSSAGVVPLYFAGNDNLPGDKGAVGTCQRLTGLDDVHGAKLDSPGDAFSLGPVALTRDNNNQFVAWSAPAGITVEAVSVKGGPAFNLYGYNPPALPGDQGLAAPVNPNNANGPYGISHVIVCWSDGGTAPPTTTLAVEKTALTRFKRTYHWGIDKSIGQSAASVPKSVGYTAHYTVQVNQTGLKDSDWEVYGAITVTNPGPAAATVTSVVDNLPGATITSCTKSLPAALAAGEAMTCDYAAARGDASPGVNSATVTATGDGVTPVVSTNDVAFSFAAAPSSTVDRTITVTDKFGSGAAGPIPGYGVPTTLTATDAEPYASQTYKYTRQITIPASAACGTTVHFPNVATIVETGASDDASFAATVQCGCTPGYWSNTRRDYPYGLTAASLLPNGNAFGAITALGWFNAARFSTAWTWSSGTTLDDMKRQMSRHGAAALLNTGAVAGFAYDKATVVGKVGGALASGDRGYVEAVKNQLQAANEAGCPLPNR